VSIKDIHVFTDADLDGAISYLTLCWFFNSELPVTVTTEKELEKEIDDFCKNKNVDNYRRIYVLDMDICNFAAKLDRSNFTIVDHHLGSINCNYDFKKARFKIKEEGSTCKLLYNVLKEHYKRDLNDSQKRLIAIGHDYDSYTLNCKESSVGLNTLFWNFQGNRLQKFVKRYYDGFKGLTKEDKRIIEYYKNKIDRFLTDSSIYYTDLEIGKKIIRVSSTFSDFCINEIAQAIIDKTNSEVGIVVNLKTNSVSYRRSKDSKFNVSKLAEKLSEGGGHESAAGGKITETFLEFTKKFKIYDQ
jgi:oligoribonuclease NrnB/cAMP/cGMP phosphodiesterase (DHH superfamily)